MRSAVVPLQLAPLMVERLRERGSEELYRSIELPLTAVLAAMEDAGVKIDTYRMGEITARLADRVEELEAKAYELAGEEFMLGSTQQVARILFEKLELTPGRKGKTGYSTDTRVLRTIRSEHPIVEVIEEWREYSKLLNTYLGPLPSLSVGGRTGACTRRSTRPSRPRAGSRPRTRTCRRSRSAPSSGARSARPSSPRPATSSSRRTTRRWSSGSWRTCPASRSFARPSRGARTSTRPTAAEVLGKDPATLTKDERNVAKMVNFGIIYGISSFGLSENLEIPREQAQAYIDAYLARFPMVQDFIQRTIEQATRDGYVTTLSAGGDRCRRSAPRTGRRARSASGSR